MSGRDSGRVIRSAKVGASMRCARRHRDRVADAGGAGAAHRGARRAPRGSIAARSASAGWPGARGRTAPSRRCRRRDRSAGRDPGPRRARRESLADLGEPARPIRHGIVLPHASSAQKRVRRRARSTTQARSSATITDPEPMCAPAARSASKVVGRVERARGQDPARRPADEDGLQRSGPCPVAAERDDGPAAYRAGPRRRRPAPAPRTWTSMVPGASRAPIAANASAPFARIQGTRRGSGRSGRPSAGCGGRASPDGAGAAPAGRACPRGP